MKRLKVVWEGFVIALQELYAHKLRSMLSLLGITIGIYCIILVFAAVDSLERSVRGSIDKMGTNTVFVEKFPWVMGTTDYPFYKYMMRPQASGKDFEALKEGLAKAEAVAIQFMLNDKTAQHKSNTAEGVAVLAVSHEYDQVFPVDIQYGRYFSLKEADRGNNVAVIGASVANALYGEGVNPVGRDFKILGRKLKVIGMVRLEGESLFNWNLDNAILAPYNYIGRLVDKNSRFLVQRIIVKARDGVSLAELKDEITNVMRRTRKLSPRQEDNFAMNQSSIITQGITQTFGIMNLAGIFIGGFAILVGGFGIANIMFVSVRERTSQIGIKKALGAPRSWILTEFLIESILLALAGGLLGLVLVYLTLILLNSLLSFVFVLSLQNIIIGLSVSGIIGLVAGISPAISASRMDPVEAMRAR